jgi:hypothetical protein
LGKVLEFDKEVEVATVNFIKNQGKDSLISLGQSSIRISDCVFMGDKSTHIVNQYVIMVSCLFGDAYDPSLFPNDAYTNQCNFGVKFQTKHVDIDPSDVCWVLKPTAKPKPEKPTEKSHSSSSDSSGNKKQTSGVAVAVALFIIITGCVGGFLVWRCWKNRDPSQALLLMYAQV